MRTHPLVVVTTRLPPQTCGIGSYSWESHQRWPALWPSVEFVAIDGGPDTSKRRDVKIRRFGGSARRLAEELERIGPADLMLHYAGRAYQRYGCPLWLPRVLRGWKRQFPGSRIMVFFHELPGEGARFTSRYFWLDRIGNGIVRRLALIADVLVTNGDRHIAQLRRVAADKEIHLIPVGSNISRDDNHAPPRRSTDFAVFGLPFGRWQTLQMFDTNVQRWHAAGHLTTLHIIGPDGDEFSRRAEAVIRAWPQSLTVVRHGLLPASEVSRLFQEARFALTNVTSETWSKSSAFMACAAHQCAVITADEGPLPVPLSYAVRSSEIGQISDAEIATRTAALAQWYFANADWPVTAARLASLWPAEHLTHG